MAIMQIKDETGKFVAIPAIQGPAGSSGVHYGNEEPSDPNINLWVDTSEALVESYSKAQVDTLIYSLPKVYSGLSTPSNSMGKDGDIYILTEE